MLSWIKQIAYALLFVALFTWFVASGYLQKLINFIWYLKNQIGILSSFFGENFAYLIGIIWVIFAIILVMGVKNSSD